MKKIFLLCSSLIAVMLVFSGCESTQGVDTGSTVNTETVIAGNSENEDVLSSDNDGAVDESDTSDGENTETVKKEIIIEPDNSYIYEDLCKVNAEYDETYTIDLSALRPTVAFPHLPENTRTVDEIGEKEVKIDQSVIGSCTNGRLEDLRAAAAILKGRKVAKDVRCIVIPGTQTIYLQAMREGLLEIFIEAGAIVSTPTCGPCLGGHMGILAENEKAVSTTNRNFIGRMGHITSEIYLASPTVAAASAVTGYITDPDAL